MTPFRTKFRSFWASIIQCEILTSWGGSWLRFRPPFLTMLALKSNLKGLGNNMEETFEITSKKGPKLMQLRPPAACKSRRPEAPSPKPPPSSSSWQPPPITLIVCFPESADLPERRAGEIDELSLSTILAYLDTYILAYLHTWPIHFSTYTLIYLMK